MDADTLRIFAAMVLFSSVTFSVSGFLVGRTINRRPMARAVANIIGASIGLALAIGVLLFAG